jgi:AIPR protein
VTRATSHVLHACQDQLPDSVQIPFRLVHTQNENVIEDVIRATNRQTEVKDDQFFAMKDFAKRLEAYFKTFPVETRLYYERRPHQYDAQDIEKIRIITHQNLVRAVGAMFWVFRTLQRDDFAI